MILGEVELALRGRFAAAAASAREAFKSGIAGRWTVLGGFLPRAEIEIAITLGQNPGERFFTVSYPYVVHRGNEAPSLSGKIHTSFLIPMEGSVEKAVDQINLFEEQGPKLMAGVISDCLSRLVLAGVEPWVLKGLVDLAVVQDVMET